MRKILPLVETPAKGVLPSWFTSKYVRSAASELGALLGRNVVCAEGPAAEGGVAARLLLGNKPAWVVVSPVSFVHAACDVMLGGEPLPFDDPSPVTDGEAVVAEELFRAVGRAAASLLGEEQVCVKEVENLFRPLPEPFGEVSCALSAEGFPKGNLTVKVYFHVDAAGPGAARPRVSLLPVTLAAVVERLRVTVGEVAALSAGDVIVLETADPFGVVLEAEGVPVFSGRCGKRGNGLAFLLEKKCEEVGSLEKVEVPELLSVEAKEETPLGMAKLKSLPVRLTVEVGRVVKPLSEVAALRAGDVIQLNRPAADYVDVLANGVVVARGEVVEVSGRYGVRISEIVQGETDV